MPAWLTPEIQAQLLDGAVVTIGLTVLTGVVSLLIGLATAIGQRSASRLSRITSRVFVDVFRNVPALILVIFFAFAVPNLFPADTRRTLFFDNGAIDALGSITGLPLPYYAIAAAAALSLNTGAHLGEVLRAGMATLAPEQLDTARSLGAGPFTLARTIVVPEGLRAAFPAVSTRLIHNMKNTALVSFVAVPDLFSVIQGSITRTFRATELLLLAAAGYLLLATVMTAGLGRVERRLNRGRPMRRELGV